MDQYDAKGRLHAEQYETLLGPFLVGPGVDRAYEFNRDGSTTVYEHGKTYIEPRKPKDYYVITKDTYASCIADYFYSGEFHGCFAGCGNWDGFDEELKRMNTQAKGELSSEWAAWLEWARGIILQVQKDGKYNV